MNKLQTALAERFTDPDEIRDVARHGCSGGVSGFIYSSELFDFFNQHEQDIEDLLDGLGLQLNDLVKDPECWSFQELRESAVWVVVEVYCQSVVDTWEE
jgi:hypothetical protein